jgi:CelD/BcsL family acetyltransferase involved in cellulose biosynthesis
LPLASAPARPSSRPTLRPRSPPPTTEVAGRPFARVEVFDAIGDAGPAWGQIAPSASASAYQSFTFAGAWFATIGAAEGAAPLIVVARNDAGAPVALLPLARSRRGPLRLATFLGGKDSNFNLGLFRAGLAWSAADVAALLAEAARRAEPRIDAFLLSNQPLQWRGVDNPLAGLERQPSPSFAFKSALPAEFTHWLDVHASKEAKKKMRKKRARLEAIAPLVHTRAAGRDEIERALDAFNIMRRARVATLGLPDPYGSDAAEEFLARLAEEGALELHALNLGGRIIAVFGALASAHRLSGLFIANDGDPEIARSSPGEIMVQAVVADAIARGFSEFDLGVGEARYKDEACEAVEELFDSAFGASARGRLAAWAFLAARRAKRAIKQSPRLKALHARLRRARAMGD